MPIFSIIPAMPSFYHVALFDFDRTLVDCNSGNLWFRAEMRAGRLPRTLAGQFVFYTFLYRLGIGDLQNKFVEAFATVRGEAEAEMDARVRAWFEAEIRPHLRPGARAALQQHRAAGDRLVVATSSSQYIGRLAAEAFGLDDYISTRLEVVDGKFTGRLVANAMGPGKAACVAQWAAQNRVDLAACTFYTDSISDLTLLERVGQPVAVHPDRRLLRIARERGWPVADWGKGSVQ